MAEERIIDRLLAEAAAAGPPTKLGEAREISVSDSFVLGVYHTARARHRGWGEKAKLDKELERSVRAARTAKIPQEEIDAAIARAEER